MGSTDAPGSVLTLTTVFSSPVVVTMVTTPLVARVSDAPLTDVDCSAADLSPVPSV